MTTPVLPAYRRDHSLLVWCRYCSRYHWHGAPAGHRLAHCWKPDSPYRESDYILTDAGPMSDAMVADSKRRRPRGPDGLRNAVP